MGINIDRATARRSALLATAALLGACYAPQGPLPTGRGVIGVEPVAEPAPVVRVRTEEEFGTGNRIRTRLDVANDAYVLVFNIGPDGVAEVIFPEEPEDRGFLRGGTSYTLQPFFTGYPTMSLTSHVSARFTRVRFSTFARPSMRGPGYIFVLASRTPFDLRTLALEGYFDGTQVGYELYDLDPEDVIPFVAAAAVGDRDRMAVRADFARYAGYDETVRPYDRRGLYAYSSSREYCDAATSSSLGWSALDDLYSPAWTCRPWWTGLPPVRVIPRPPMPDSTASDSTRDTIPIPQPITATARASRALRTTAAVPTSSVELTPDTRERMRRRDAAVERRMRMEAESGAHPRFSHPRDDFDATRRTRSAPRPPEVSRQPARTTASEPQRQTEPAKPAPAPTRTNDTGRLNPGTPQNP